MSSAMRSAFSRIETEYRPTPGPYVGGAVPPVAMPVAGTFSASRTFDKLIVLCILAVASAAVGYLVVPAGVAFVCMILAFFAAMLGWFRLSWSRVLAPAYSVLEGVALGAVSAAFESIGHGIVPAAVVFTAAVFVACLFTYRTGLVRVTPRFANLAFIGAVGIAAVGLLSLLGLPIPGLTSLTGAGLVFSVLALAVAVLSLFTDFEFVRRSEAMGISAEAEWAAAFAMMTALVLVYISMLRILGAAYGGGGRRR